jgi:hypothetical protein
MLNPFQASRIEAVEPGHLRLRIGPVARQGAQVAGGREQTFQTDDFVGPQVESQAAHGILGSRRQKQKSPGESRGFSATFDQNLYARPTLAICVWTLSWNR